MHGVNYENLIKNLTLVILLVEAAAFFATEFGKNLYFAWRVLNTLLYVLMQQIESADGEFGLLECGGVQLAGPPPAWPFFTFFTLPGGTLMPSALYLCRRIAAVTFSLVIIVIRGAL